MTETQQSAIVQFTFYECTCAYVWGQRDLNTGHSQVILQSLIEHEDSQRYKGPVVIKTGGKSRNTGEQ